jgi:hypothetical protein
MSLNNLECAILFGVGIFLAKGYYSFSAVSFGTICQQIWNFICNQPYKLEYYSLLKK